MTPRQMIAIAALLWSIGWPGQEALAQRKDDLRLGVSAAVEPGLLEDLPGRERLPRTYWLTGALITAVPAMIAFNVVAKPDEGTTFLAEVFGRIVGTALVGAVFAVPGAVIGGLFPKDPKPDSTATGVP